MPLPDGSKRKLDIDVDAPSGKTKNVLVDLEGKIPGGTRRLRLTTACGIYWDCAMLAERVDAPGIRETSLAPNRTDQHWRGHNRYAHLPAEKPGCVRDFFRHVVGWDQDADFHAWRGGEVEPLPFAGVESRAYDRHPRPANLDDRWRRPDDARRVGPVVISPEAKSRPTP